MVLGKDGNEAVTYGNYTEPMINAQEKSALLPASPKLLALRNRWLTKLKDEQRLSANTIEAYERASTIDPDEPEWLASRAVVLLRESRLEEAAVAASPRCCSGAI